MTDTTIRRIFLGALAVILASLVWFGWVMYQAAPDSECPPDQMTEGCERGLE